MRGRNWSHSKLTDAGLVFLLTLRRSSMQVTLTRGISGVSYSPHPNPLGPPKELLSYWYILLEGRRVEL